MAKVAPASSPPAFPAPSAPPLAAAPPPPSPSAPPPPPPTSPRYPAHHGPRPSTLWNRLVLSVLAISLLWASSLKTAVYITERFVRIPPATFPIQVCRAAATAIGDQATAYRRCAARQLATCDADLDFAAEEERARSGAAQATNVLKLDAAETLYSSCGAAFTASQAAIQRWLQLSTLHAVPYVSETARINGSTAPQCPASDRARAQALLGDSSGSKSQVMAFSAQYSKEARGTVRRMAQYSIQLNEYNAAYIANKTQGIRAAALDLVQSLNAPRVGGINASFADVRLQFAAVVACIAAGPLSAGPPCTLLPRGARQRLEDMVTDFNGQFQGAAAGFRQYMDNWRAVSAASAEAWRKFSTFYRDLLDAINRAGLTTRDFGSLFDTFRPGEIRVDPGVFLDGAGIITDLPPVPTLDGVWAAVSPLVDLYLQDLSLASLDTSLRALRWATDLELALGALDVAPQDYDPPRYRGSDGEVVPIEAEVESHEALSDSFVARTATSLETFGTYDEYVGSGGANTSGLNASSAFDNLPRFDFKFDLKYETLATPNLDLDNLLDIFDSIPSLALFTDYIYRIYTSTRIIWRFYTQTAIKMPVVDLRGAPSTASRMEACVGLLHMLNPRRLLARLLASRYLPYLLMAGVLFPALVYAVLLYIAAYKDYQRGCVFNTSPEGSYAARATFSLAYNFAAYGGNQDMYDGLKTYNQRRSQYCADYGKASQSSQLSAERYIETMRGMQVETQAKVGLLASCMNLTTLDGAFRRGCCDASGVAMAPYDDAAPPAYYRSCEAEGWSSPANATACPYNANYNPPRPFPPVSTTLSAPACAKNASSALTWALDDGVFHCEVLPSCAPTCSGPHPELTRAWSRHCACATEWAIHAYVMAGSLVLMTYIVLNLARKLVLQSAAQIHWRALFSGTITVLAPCDLQGELHVLPKRRPRRWHLFSRAAARVDVAPASPRREAGVESEQRKEQPGAEGQSTENPLLAAAAASAATPVGGGRGEEEEQQQQREGQQEEEGEPTHLFVKRKLDVALRVHERLGWVKALVAVALLVGAALLLTKAPAFLEYQP